MKKTERRRPHPPPPRARGPLLRAVLWRVTPRDHVLATNEPPQNAFPKLFGKQ